MSYFYNEGAILTREITSGKYIVYFFFFYIYYLFNMNIGAYFREKKHFKNTHKFIILFIHKPTKI